MTYDASSLPQTNARLTAIHAPGPSEDFNIPQGALGAMKWSAAVRGNNCYVRDRNRANYSQTQGELDRTRDTTLIIPATLRFNGEPVDIHGGDWVVYDFAGVTGITRRVQDLDVAILAGATSTVKLHLDPTSQRAAA